MNLETATDKEILTELFLRALKHAKIESGASWIYLDDQSRFGATMAAFGKTFDSNMQEVINSFLVDGTTTVTSIITSEGKDGTIEETVPSAPPKTETH